MMSLHETERFPAIGSRARVRPSVCVSAVINAHTGYGGLAIEFIAGLCRRGWDVEVRPIRLEETVNTYQASVPLEIKERITAKPKSALELMISPIDRPNLPTVGKRSVYFTMCESTRLTPRQVAVVNKADVVITTGQWLKKHFIASGITKPVHTVPLGIWPEIFVETPVLTSGVCVFGAAGCLSSGAKRKRLDIVINAFRHAFDGINDVDLRLKIMPGERVDIQNDPRIRCNAEFMPWLSLQRWFSGLSAFVNIGLEGWGMLAHQSCACGKPVIAPVVGGSTEFLNPECCYPVEYWTQWNSIGARSLGAFSTPDFHSLVCQMRRIYLDRVECAEIGRKAAEQARRFTWEHSLDKLEEVLQLAT